MATHSSILAWEIPWAWWATVHGVSESDTTEPSEHPDARQGGALACVVFLPGVLTQPDPHRSSRHTASQ